MLNNFTPIWKYIYFVKFKANVYEFVVQKKLNAITPNIFSWRWIYFLNWHLLNFSQFYDQMNNPSLQSVLASRLFQEIDTPLLFYPRNAIENAMYVTLMHSTLLISSLTTPLLPRIIMDRSWVSFGLIFRLFSSSTASRNAVSRIDSSL